MTYTWPDRLAYVIDEAVHASGISRRELYRAMSDGRLKFSFVAGRRRIFPDDLKKFLRGGVAA
jgi:predicted site-specific integrase-resolvase